MAPWNGSAPNQSFGRSDGTRTGDDLFQQQAAAPVDIDPVLMDIHETDLKDGINACLKKDGGNTATADLPMGGFTPRLPTPTIGSMAGYARPSTTNPAGSKSQSSIDVMTALANDAAAPSDSTENGVTFWGDYA